MHLICDKVTENIAGASERPFYFFYCLLHMFGSEIKRIDSFLFAEKYFLPRFATTGAENKIAWVPAVADFMRREILFSVLSSWTVLPQSLEKIYDYVGCHCNDKCSIRLMSDGSSETKSAQSWAGRALKLAWKCRRQRNICMRWNRKAFTESKAAQVFCSGGRAETFYVIKLDRFPAGSKGCCARIQLCTHVYQQRTYLCVWFCLKKNKIKKGNAKHQINYMEEADKSCRTRRAEFPWRSESHKLPLWCIIQSRRAAARLLNAISKMGFVFFDTQ